MTALAATRTVAAAARRQPAAGARVLAWLLALDAGFRGAHALAHASDARLADMGITRDAAQAEYARHTGSVDTPASGTW